MAEILARLEDKIESNVKDKEREKKIRTLQTFLRLGHSMKNICHMMKMEESEVRALMTDVDEEILREAWWVK